MSSKLREGERFQTNAKFRVRWKMVWTGVLLRRSTTIQGCWLARVDGMKKIQYVNEKWLEEADQ